MGLTTQELAQRMDDAVDGHITGVIATTPHGSYTFEITDTALRPGTGMIELFLAEIDRRDKTQELPAEVEARIDGDLSQVHVHGGDTSTLFGRIDGQDGFAVTVAKTYFVPATVTKDGTSATMLALSKAAGHGTTR